MVAPMNFKKCNFVNNTKKKLKREVSSNGIWILFFNGRLFFMFIVISQKSFTSFTANN